ncbi:MAG: hypothetical protein LBJ64_03915 [Deltaproteobacteria bacterium]|jgi:hypothetical protein|nr:hypothetical protein [Deltaproteobacteria bacterium]
MKLDYNILWVDGVADWVEAGKDELAAYLFSRGFELEVAHLRRAPSSAEMLELMLNRCHLLLIDCNLGEKRTGADLLETIRGQGIFTEAVLYSSDPDLLKKAKKKSLEGVYWAEKDDNFADKAKKIIDLTIRKVMDLSTMRSLAVAEMADIVPVLNEVILQGDKKAINEECKRFRRKFIDVIFKSLRERSKTFENISPRFRRNFTSLLTETNYMDISVRWRAAVYAAGLLKADEESVGVLNKYIGVLNRLNDITSGQAEKGDDGQERIIGKFKPYSWEDALKIRLDLLKQRDNLIKIIKAADNEEN